MIENQMKKNPDNLIPIGWREWISFPEWGIEYLKVKVDTGARTSSLHVRDIEHFQKGSEPWVCFTVFPWQKSLDGSARVSAAVKSFRKVRSSSGSQEERPVIEAGIRIAGETIVAELTLTNRDQMGFRMLLGREAIRKRFLVVPGRSYLGGMPALMIRRKNRGKS